MINLTVLLFGCAAISMLQCVDAGLVRRFKKDPREGPETDENEGRIVYPYGFPHNIPVNGDLMPNVGFYPGYGQNLNPCAMNHPSNYGYHYHGSFPGQGSGNYWLYPVPNYTHLYYDCLGKVATLRMCLGNTRFYPDQNYCH